jgi:two-component system CitB family response regulator
MTLDKISLYTNKFTDSFTAEEIASGLGISRSTARRYLEYLVTLGKVKADLSYGTVGRPERVYRNTDR